MIKTLHFVRKMNNFLNKSVGALIKHTNQGHLNRAARFISCVTFSRQIHTLPLSRGKLFQTCRYRLYGNSPSDAPTAQDPVGTALLDLVTYEAICSDTLESLCEYFDQLVEGTSHLKNADITYSDGVLTINFGQKHGIYVINRQSPNRQIWLSSPTSGPKRYDFCAKDSKHKHGCWIYKHDGKTLHELLQQEIAPIVRKDVDFFQLAYGNRK